MDLKSYFAEFVGIVIGDGFLDNYDTHYRIGIVGSPLEKRYYDYIQQLIFLLWNKETPVVFRSKGLRITFNSKKAFLTLVEDYEIPIGKRKSFTVVIPEVFMNDWWLVRHTLRGIFDTDGSVFTSNKKGAPSYPSLEITTSSYLLAYQIRGLLLSQGFRVTNIWSYKSKNKNGFNLTYKLALNGYRNFERWFSEIGSSNFIKQKKAEMILLSNKPLNR